MVAAQKMPPKKTPDAGGSLFGQLSLRTKLIIMVAGITIVSVTALSIYNYQNIRTQVTQSVSVSAEDAAHAQSEEIGNVLAQSANSLQSIGSSTTIQELVQSCNVAHCGDPAAGNLDALEAEWQAANAANTDNALVQSVLNSSASSNLSAFRESFPNNVEVIVTDQYGLTMAASNRTSRYSYLSENWWTTAYNNGHGNIYIGQPELIKNIEEYAIPIAVPIYASGTRQVIGVLYSGIRLIPPRDVLASLKIGKTGEADLLFPNGQILTPAGVLTQWPSATLTQLKNAPTDALIQMPMPMLHNGMHLVDQLPVTSSDPVAGSAISKAGWRVVVSIEPAEALAPVNSAALFNIVISLGVLMAAVLLVFGVTQYLTGPIARLTVTAEQVRAGDLNSRAKVESRDEIGRLAQTFNQMTAQLNEQMGTLEQRVSERTQELEHEALRVRAAAEIARDISSAPSLDELLTRSSELIVNRFNFYHAGIFLLDDKKEYAVLRASPTEAGKQLIANSHRLRVGEQGIVGRVAASGEARIALDTGADAVYFNNPFLPTTRSEMALPLKTRNEIFGVLDIQSDQPRAFAQEDIEILQVLADQLAIAIERINLLERVEDQLKEIEQAYQEFTQRSWQGLARNQTQITGYRFDGMQLQPIIHAPENLMEAVQTATDNSPQTQSGSSESQAIPIRLRGQTIGAVNLRSRSDTISKETIAIVEQIADRLASALENARLTEDTRRRAQRERAISEVSTKISAFSDTDSIMRSAVEELGRRLGSSTEVTLELGGDNQEKDHDKR